MTTRVSIILAFTEESHRKGMVVCSECNRPIKKHEDFFVDAPLPTVSQNEIGMVTPRPIHEACYRAKNGIADGSTAAHSAP